MSVSTDTNDGSTERLERAETEVMVATVVSPGDLVVNSETSEEGHLVRLDEKGRAEGCSCPDATYNLADDELCKHQLAWENGKLDKVELGGR